MQESHTAPRDTCGARALAVEAFSLLGDSDTAHLHFEDSPDLFVQYRPEGHGDFAGLVVVELGIDGELMHRVRTDVHRAGGRDDADAYGYCGNRVAALEDAIEALTAVRDQLAAMRPAGEVQAAERNAFEIGRDAERVTA